MSQNPFLKYIIPLILITKQIKSLTQEEITETINSKTITCGSTLRIQNIITKYYLSSFGMNWSTGSKLQIITGIEEDNDINSLFLIKEGDGIFPCKNGENILCDSIIRLEHISTGKNIHSHEFPSFITGKQEACAFGDNGIGDVNDNFKIICYKQKGEKKIFGKSEFFLQHVPTGKYLFIDYKKSMFNDFNCRGCPIRGQREVSLTDEKDKQCLWKVAGGIIFESDDNQKNDDGNFDNGNDDKKNENEKEKEKKNDQFDGRRKNDL
jgi:dolichyl-phosphate-mannose--protein O-mannosyl transferase